MSNSRMIDGMQKRFATIRPYLVGAVVGGIVIMIVSLKAGWVVGAGGHRSALNEARLEVVATVCAQQANAQWLADGNEASGLDGWSNEDRKALAEQFTPELENIEGADITSLCNEILRPA